MFEYHGYWCDKINLPLCKNVITTYQDMHCKMRVSILFYVTRYLCSIVLLLLESGAAVTTDILADESELLGAVRTDQTLVVEILLTNGTNLY